jgi:hypothetical protein
MPQVLARHVVQIDLHLPNRGCIGDLFRMDTSEHHAQQVGRALILLRVTSSRSITQTPNDAGAWLALKSTPSCDQCGTGRCDTFPTTTVPDPNSGGLTYKRAMPRRCIAKAAPHTSINVSTAPTS